MPINNSMPFIGNHEPTRTTPKSLGGPQVFTQPYVLSGPIDGAAELTRHTLPLSTICLLTGKFDREGVAALASTGIDVGTYAIVSPQFRCDDGAEVNADVYVGSSSNCGKRVTKHLMTDRVPGAERFFVVHSTSDELNAEHVRQAEAIVQELARRQPGANVIGRPERYRAMSTYDESLMRSFAPQAIALLANAGFPLTISNRLWLDGIPFLSAGDIDSDATIDTSVTEPADQTDTSYLWTFKGSGDLASFQLYGRHNEQGNFVVLAGSHFRTDGNYALAPEIFNRRDEVIERGRLTDMANMAGRMILRKDCVLRSPNVALKVMTKCKRDTETAWRVTYEPAVSNNVAKAAA